MRNNELVVNAQIDRIGKMHVISLSTSSDHFFFIFLEKNAFYCSRLSLQFRVSSGERFDSNGIYSLVIGLPSEAALEVSVDRVYLTFCFKIYTGSQFLL